MYAIDRMGDEPAVLCVHGFLQSSAFWEPTVDNIAQSGTRAIAVDLPGFARSSHLPGPFTLESFADFLAEFLAARNLQRIVLLGGSMGGAVAQHFALRHPERLVRLLLVATGPYTGDPPAALANADALASAPWDAAAVEPIVRGFFRHPPTAAQFERYLRIAQSASQPAAVEAMRSNAQARTLERLHEIGVPTLIVQGRHDRSRTPEHGAEMRDRIPDARLEILEQSGHTPQLEEPEAFQALANPFLLNQR